MSLTPRPSAADEVLAVAFGQAYDVIGEAVRAVGVGALIRLSVTHPDLFRDLNAALLLLEAHDSRRVYVPLGSPS